MTTKEAAEYLGVNDSRVRQMIRDGVLPAEKNGRDWLIHQPALAAARQEREGPRPAGKRGRPYKTS